MKPKLENAVNKLASKPVLMRILPLSIDDLKSDVLIRRTSCEAKNLKQTYDNETVVVAVLQSFFNASIYTASIFFKVKSLHCFLNDVVGTSPHFYKPNQIFTLTMLRS